MTDYAGNAGTAYSDRGDAIGGLGTFAAGDGNDGVLCCRVDAFGRNAWVTSSDLTDGASNTIMVGEKNLNPNFCTDAVPAGRQRRLRRRLSGRRGSLGRLRRHAKQWQLSAAGSCSGHRSWIDLPHWTRSPRPADGHNFWFGSSHAGAPSSSFATARSR